MTPRINFPAHRRGTRFFETIMLLDSAGDPKDVSAFGFKCQGRAYAGAADVLAELTITIVDAEEGHLEAEFAAADTLAAELDHVPTVEFSLLSIDGDGDQREVAILILPLLPQI